MSTTDTSPTTSSTNFPSVPEYLYRELAATDHPMIKDASYGGGLTPDYDSPLLLERFRAILNAFSAWLDGNVTGTQIKRRDVRVSFPDAKGIEHPLCLSKCGRRASDGSYLLGTLAPRH